MAVKMIARVLLSAPAHSRNACPGVSSTDRDEVRAILDRPPSRPLPEEAEDQPAPVRPSTRITLRPHDPITGEEVEKEDVVKGYEYDRGQYVTFTPDELKALDLESSKVIDLEMFVPRGEVDPSYLNSAYYLYPDGQMAVEAIRVIGAPPTRFEHLSSPKLTAPMLRCWRLLVRSSISGPGNSIRAGSRIATRRRCGS